MHSGDDPPPNALAIQIAPIEQFVRALHYNNRRVSPKVFREQMDRRADVDVFGCQPGSENPLGLSFVGSSCKPLYASRRNLLRCRTARAADE